MAIFSCYNLTFRILTPKIIPTTRKHTIPNNPVICTVFVQYMYSICTLLKRTNTVHILYKYCTYDRANIINTWFSILIFTHYFRCR